MPAELGDVAVDRAPDSTCWLHPAVEVQASLIAGRGLVTTEALGAGTVVSRLGGKLTTSAELGAIEVDEGVHLVLDPGADNRFANHSCDPNLGWAGEYTLVAIRDIAVDEELTHDYATSNGDPDFVLWCHCETYRCRQVVEGRDWLIPQLRTRYDGYWTPLLRRRIESIPSGPG